LNLSRVTNTDVVLSFLGVPAGEGTVAVAVGTSLGTSLGGGMVAVQHNAKARDDLETPETTARRAHAHEVDACDSEQLLPLG
jgi:hypothetical protein